MAEFSHPVVAYRAIEGPSDDIGVPHGHEAMRHLTEQWHETFDGSRLEQEPFPVWG